MRHSLEIDSVSKSFEYKKILTDVYLKCETSDIIGVFGRNGSGKSTLLKIIYGIENADNKFLKIDCKVLNKGYSENNSIGYLPQHNYIPKNFTVEKVISLCLNKDKQSLFYDDDDIKKIIDYKTGILSGGELRYFCVKLLLFGSTKFCLLDEPYSGLSPIYADKINKLITGNSCDKGIIITDHNYQYLLDIATKIFLIKDGYGRFLNNKNELIANGYLSIGMI